MTSITTSRKTERGQGLLEFALILPILLLIIFGIIDLGRVLMTYAMGSNNLRDALRQAEVLGYESSTPPYLQCGAMRNRLRQVFFINIPTDGYTIEYLEHNTTAVIGDDTPLGTVAGLEIGNCNGTASADGPATFVDSGDEIDNGDILHIAFDTDVFLITPGLTNILPSFPMRFSGERTILVSLPLQDDPEECWEGTPAVDGDPYSDQNGDGFPDCDTDSDGLDDFWEACHWGNCDTDITPDELAQTGTDDPDLDGCNNGCEESRGSDPTTPHSDEDGINDGDEAYGNNPFGYITDPTNNDTDEDDIWDNDEINGTYDYLTNPRLYSTDEDCLGDGDEVFGINGDPDRTSDPLSANSDGDGMDDCEEAAAGTNPELDDTDGDSLSDSEEIDGIVGPITGITYVTNPTDDDSDNDGLEDGQEVLVVGSDPNDDDTDDDGVLDGPEVNGWLITVNGDNENATGDPNDPHSDDDGLSDLEEFDGFTINIEYLGLGGVPVSQSRLVQTLPKSNDTDNDGIDDDDEMAGVLGCVTDPSEQDTDQDGLNDGDEAGVGADPCNQDSDDDGQADGMDPDPAGVDSDHDGLVDEWEEQWWGSIDVTTGAEDSDGDGCDNNCEEFYNIDPTDTDSDNDGLLDGQESNGNYSNPAFPDTDNDGLWDGDEASYGTLPRDEDTDDDGIEDGEEVIPGDDTYVTNPLDSDHDNDGLLDGQETANNYSDPTVGDTDGDGLTDFAEYSPWTITVNGGTRQVTSNARDNDSDDDGLLDGVEYSMGTDPLDTDTDDDGLLDGEEAGYSTIPTDDDSDDDGLLDGIEVQGYDVEWEDSAHVTQTIHTTSDPNNENSDGDNLLDGQEYDLGTDADNEDTDGDNLTDSQEALGFQWTGCNNNTYTTDPLKWDSDGDTLSDEAEIKIHCTDPNDTDTDNDGIPDDLEVGTGCAATPPRLRINDVTAVEPDEYQTGSPADARNSATMTFTVALDCGVVGQAVSASWSTVPSSADGTLNTTAIVTEDFVTGGGSISLTRTAANPTPTTTLSITILGDQKKTGTDNLNIPNGEDDGTQGCGTPLYVVIRLSGQSPVTVQLYDAYGLATIRNDGC